MTDEQMTRRQRRLLERQERNKSVTPRRRLHAGHVVGLIVLIGVIGAIVYGIKKAPATTALPTYTATPVHWHANFEVELCGKKQDFSSYGSGTTRAGSPLFHTHGDGVIHIEGRIIAKKDIALGKFFDYINVPFDRDQIMDKKNGDECPARGSSPGAPGKPGTVKMLVNGQPNQEFRDYVGQYTPDAKDHVIRIVFD